jgi:Rrf2 family transcriptional regulator, cysteine metabolism repressor
MMELSTKGRYATRILVNLACRDKRYPARKQEIAESEGISVDYVGQLLMKLRAAGFVQSHRGVNGGFTLACDPRKVTVADILEAVEGPICIAPCQTRSCARTSVCVTQAVWKKANKALKDVLTGITLADMAGQSEQMRTASFEI